MFMICLASIIVLPGACITRTHWLRFCLYIIQTSQDKIEQFGTRCLPSHAN